MPLTDWSPPEEWQRITVLDAHTEGEPFRVVLEGFPELRGSTILDMRRDAQERFDHLRKALMWEPRGHADMYGCLLTPAVTKEADFGVLFLHNEGFSTMCGHGIIAISMVAVETGMVAGRGPVTEMGIDTPAGLVRSTAEVIDGRVRTVAFKNVPSFVVDLDNEVEVPGVGTVRYDLAFGGAFYGFVDALSVGLTCSPRDYRSLIDKGIAIKKAVAATRSIAHPFSEDLSFLYGVIFIGAPERPESHSRNVCVFADGEVDRCPTGTGVSARLAIHRARGQIALGEPITIESILGTSFTGRVLEDTSFGPYDAVLPEVQGTAHITGRSELFLDPDDPLGHGFFLR